MDSKDERQRFEAMPYPVYNLRRELTLKGVIQKYWSQISNQWKASRTIKESIADYERRILMEADPFKSISDYTRADFEVIISSLSCAGDYSVQTEEHYRHLIRLVIDAYIEGGEHMDLSLASDSPEKDDTYVNKVGLVKSLTEEEDQKLEKWIESLNVETVNGPQIGVAYIQGIS